MAKAQVLRQCMVEGLAQRGELDEQWRAAFTEVARHVFVPELVWRQDRDSEGDCELVPMRRAEDLRRWLELTYANTMIITQVDDGHPAGEDGCGFEVSSSVSMPGVVAQMLTRVVGPASFMWLRVSRPLMPGRSPSPPATTGLS